VPVAVGRKVEGGVYVVDGAVIDATAGRPVPVADLTGSTTLWGLHNWQNAGAAVAAARSLGVPAAALAKGLATFPGLAHRLELVAEGKGLRFVNDSKATNADATARALASFPVIYWIAGGRAKAGGLAGTEAYWDRVAHAFLIGEAAPAFAGQLKGRVPLTPCGDLATAVNAAAHRAWADRRPGAVVLLSPACASFDQFRDFEERGAAFRAVVQDVLARCGGYHEAVA
jgi:UDP-N-acetylmuramoylalanine--D-glutamate ligase